MKLKDNVIIKRILISGICFIHFLVLLFFIFVDGVAKKGSSGVSGFIEQDSLRKTLGDWYQLVFYTFHINIYFSITGMLYGFFYQNNIIKNLFFCAVSYMLLCLFAMFVFRFNSFKTNMYESIKTLSVHGIAPTISLIMLFSIRKEIILDWKILILNSFYITFYIILTLIIYYNFKFTPDTSYPNKPLWIYGFLDYDNQIMFIPLNTMTSTIIGITFLLLITPMVGMVLFIFMKLIFNIKMNDKKLKRKNQTL
ncbi:MAG: hypothetical protein HDR43_00495 [Mycoplasma sp.]|nr:hypothetical protein [Mycoplasma sp.]